MVSGLYRSQEKVAWEVKTRYDKSMETKTRYPREGEIWEHPRFKVQVKVVHADNITLNNIFGKVVLEPLDGGSIHTMTIFDFLDNGFVKV